jgi:membrane AbrB-like protein
VPGWFHRAAGAQPALAGVAVCTAAGALFSWLHSPLPWMIGPLLAMAVFRFSGIPLGAPPGAGKLAQWCIGTTLGLYFTPVVARVVGSYWWIFVAAALFSLVVAWFGGLWLERHAGTDRKTAFLASVPGGAQEMASIGDRYGARVDRIAVAQSVRILMVVLIVPFGLAWAGVHGADVYEGVRAPIVWSLLPQLFACTAIGAVLMTLLRWPNAWMLGPLFVSIGLTAQGVEWTSMPSVISNAAQVLIGCNLGQRYDRSFVRAAPRFVAVVCASVLIAMALSAVFALGLAWLADLRIPTLLLATAPGGMAEMSLTARTLALGVPIVTAAHVSRVVILVSTTGPLFSLLMGRHAAGRHG